MRVHMKLVMIKWVRVVNFTSENLITKSTVFPHCSICKYT